MRDNVAEFGLPLAPPPSPLFLQGSSGDIRLIPGKIMVLFVNERIKLTFGVLCDFDRC